MNAARAMGNTLDETYIPHLTEAFRRESDERVKAMTAWALGRIGGPAAKQALAAFLVESAGSIRSEILAALEGASPRKGTS
jgi:epoxyqueuosine reductase